MNKERKCKRKVFRIKGEREIKKWGRRKEGRRGKGKKKTKGKMYKEKDV